MTPSPTKPPPAPRGLVAGLEGAQRHDDEAHYDARSPAPVPRPRPRPRRRPDERPPSQVQRRRPADPRVARAILGDVLDQLVRDALQGRGVLEQRDRQVEARRRSAWSRHRSARSSAPASPPGPCPARPRSRASSRAVSGRSRRRGGGGAPPWASAQQAWRRAPRGGRGGGEGGRRHGRHGSHHRLPSRTTPEPEVPSHRHHPGHRRQRLRRQPGLPAAAPRSAGADGEVTEVTPAGRSRTAIAWSALLVIVAVAGAGLADLPLDHAHTAGRAARAHRPRARRYWRRGSAPWSCPL